MSYSEPNLKYSIAPHMEQSNNRLFVPRIYGFESHDEMLQVIAQHPLCHITSQFESELHMTSLPLVYRECPTSGSKYLIGHIAKRNPHLSLLTNGCNVLCVFTGPSTYISPRWFVDKLTVPTWSYCSVQIHGSIEIIEEQQDLLKVLGDSISEFEDMVSSAASAPSDAWSIRHADPKLVDTLLSGITGIRITVKSMSGVKRQVQEKSINDRCAIAQGLTSSHNVNAQQVGLQIQEALLKPEE